MPSVPKVWEDGHIVPQALVRRDFCGGVYGRQRHFVHWVVTCFPTEAIQMHTLLSGETMSLTVDEKGFSHRPEQELKEKAIEEIRILLLGVQSLFLCVSSQ